MVCHKNHSCHTEKTYRYTTLLDSYQHFPKVFSTLTCNLCDPFLHLDFVLQVFGNIFEPQSFLSQIKLEKGNSKRKRMQQLIFKTVSAGLKARL